MSQVYSQDGNWKTAYERIPLNSVTIRALGSRHYNPDFNPKQAEYGVWLFDEADLAHMLYAGNYTRVIPQ